MAAWAAICRRRSQPGLGCRSRAGRAGHRSEEDRGGRRIGWPYVSYSPDGRGDSRAELGAAAGGVRRRHEDGDGVERAADADELDGDAEHNSEHADDPDPDELDKHDEYVDGHDNDSLGAGAGVHAERNEGGRDERRGGSGAGSRLHAERHVAVPLRPDPAGAGGHAQRDRRTATASRRSSSSTGAIWARTRSCRARRSSCSGKRTRK